MLRRGTTAAKLGEARKDCLGHAGKALGKLLDRPDATARIVSGE
jgi:hypothetical protein